MPACPDSTRAWRRRNRSSASRVLNHSTGAAEKPDVSVALSRDTLNSIILQQAKLDDSIKAGDVKVDGDRAKLNQLVSYLDNFKFWFNIVTP